MRIPTRVPAATAVLAGLLFTSACAAAEVTSGAGAATIVSDPVYGRQLQVRTPDGLLVKFNQMEPDPYL